MLNFWASLVAYLVWLGALMCYIVSSMNNDTIKGIRVSSVVGAASISQPQCRQEITGWPS